MNQNINFLHVGLLIEEEYNRNHLRILRRHIRDLVNPFDISIAHFKQMYRLDQQCTINFIRSLEPVYNPSNSRIPLHIKVLTMLNFMATGSFQNPIGVNFCLSLSQSSVCRIIQEICSLTATYLLPQYIKFPSTAEEQNTVKIGFFEKWGSRGVVGVIDGTHVEILAPPVSDNNHPPFVYINRKGKHSINVMLICDSNNKIIACSARFPGSVHDAAIWQMSSVKRFLKRNYENGDSQTHLFGDSGYPLEPWLFTPFGNPGENTPEAMFNTELCSVRNVIERTNGILKGRFRCLSKHRTLLYHPTRAANIIYTACVLHNIALDANIILAMEEEEYEEDEEPNIVRDPDIGNDVYNLGRAARAEYIRNNLINQ